MACAHDQRGSDRIWGEDSILGECQEKKQWFPLSTGILNDGRDMSMPSGPFGEKRSADLIGEAIMPAKFATGKITEELKEPFGKVRSGTAGAKARAKKLAQEERTAIAQKAAARRSG
jgi:hypothetical protein